MSGLPPITTFGHGTLAPEPLADLLAGHGVEVVADVRRHPGSRRHPQFRREEMERWLPARGLSYRWLPELGGRRPADPESANTALRNESFRGYADHMAGGEFREGIGRLLSLASERRVALLCAESVWWRCHRRLVADHLVLVEGVPVEHLLHDGRVRPHEPSPEARRVDGHLVYDAGTLSEAGDGRAG